MFLLPLWTLLLGGGVIVGKSQTLLPFDLPQGEGKGTKRDGSRAGSSEGAFLYHIFIFRGSRRTPRGIIWSTLSGVYRTVES